MTVSGAWRRAALLAGVLTIALAAIAPVLRAPSCTTATAGGSLCAVTSGMSPPANDVVHLSSSSTTTALGAANIIVGHTDAGGPPRW